MKSYLHKAIQLDKDDQLARFRDRFFNTEERMIYLDGNSLGKLPVETLRLAEKLMQHQWGNRLIRSWNEHWIDLPRRIAAKIAKVIGAGEDEVYVGDTTSINLFKLAWAALQYNPGRKKILTDSLNFPTDLYVLQGLVNQQFRAHAIRKVESGDGLTSGVAAMENELDDQVAFITLSLVAYKSAFLYDMAAVNSLAHQHDSLVIWDLSHAAGAVPVDLNGTGADMAVGCTYKYLNGGPGAPAFLFVRRDLQDRLANPVWAWFSHRKPFDFDPVYDPAEGIQKFATSTPTILSLAAIEPGIDLVLEAGIENLRQKSLEQGRFLLEMIREHLVPLGFTIASPVEADQRGSHISVRHPEGYRINRAMIDPDDGSVAIIPDFRPPDNIRLGIAPLYNSFQDLYTCVERMQEIVKKGKYKSYSKKKLTVT